MSVAKDLLDLCRARGMKICCAESLTGGLLADAFVSVPGASDTYRGSVNTYAADSKASILGVSSEWLAAHGPVNSFTAESMALGALHLFGCDGEGVNEEQSGIALSTTGVAGPGPDGDIPAGTVFLGCALSDGRVRTRECHFSGGRAEVRRKAVEAALDLGLSVLREARS